MIWLVIALTIAVVWLTILLVMMHLRNERQKDALLDGYAEHAKCMAHIAHYTGNQFAALVLKAAAEDYSSPAGQHLMQVIQQQRSQEQHPPYDVLLPSIWLNERADNLVKEVQP